MADPAVQSVTQVKRSGTGTSETAQYLVRYDSFTASLPTARQARVASAGGLAIPAEGALLSGTSWRAKVTAEQRQEDPRIWDVTATWSANEAARETQPAGSNVKWNVQVKSRGVAYERSVYEDLNGNPIVNSAGGQFDTQPKIIQYDEAFSVSFNTNYGNIVNAIRAKRGRVNSDTVTMTIKGVTHTFAAGTLKLVDADYEIDYDYTTDSANVWAVNLELHYRADEWVDVQVADHGFYDSNGAPFKDADGNNKIEATLLDGSGGALSSGALSVPREFTVLARVEFSSLFTGV